MSGRFRLRDVGQLVGAGRGGRKGEHVDDRPIGRPNSRIFTPIYDDVINSCCLSLSPFLSLPILLSL